MNIIYPIGLNLMLILYWYFFLKYAIQYHKINDSGSMKKRIIDYFKINKNKILTDNENRSIFQKESKELGKALLRTTG